MYVPAPRELNYVEDRECTIETLTKRPWLIRLVNKPTVFFFGILAAAKRNENMRFGLRVEVDSSRSSVLRRQ